MAWPDDYNTPVERTFDLGDPLREKAMEIHDARREMNSEGPPLSQATCEAAIPPMYDLAFKPSYLRKYPKSIQVIMMDGMGRSIRVIASTYWPKRVYEYKLDVDILVFAASRRYDVAAYGWLPAEKIKEAPTSVMKRDGDEVTAFEIEREVMNSMPDEWDFEEGCDHKWYGMFNGTLEATECFKCNYHYNNKKSREQWAVTA
jgi:hypothetical protein